MNKAQLRKKAFEVAAGLIQAMDLEQFWGADVIDTHEEIDLDNYQTRVVTFLKEKYESLK